MPVLLGFHYHDMAVCNAAVALITTRTYARQAEGEAIWRRQKQSCPDLEEMSVYVRWLVMMLS